MQESYTIADFTTEDWWFRPPHDGSLGIDFDALEAMHKAETSFVDTQISVGDGYWFSVHLSNSSVTVYIYSVDGWTVNDAETRRPYFAHPMLLVIGTTFDGIRETQGTPCSTCNLKSFAAAVLAVDEYFTAKGWVL